MPGCASSRLLALAVAVLTLDPRAAWGDGVNLGGGPAMVDVQSSQLAGGGSSEGGYRLFFGYRMWERVAFEVAVATPGTLVTLPTTDIAYPADRAEFSTLELGLRLEFLSLSTHRFSPWVQLGLGFAFLNWETYFYQQGGTGLALGFGADLRLAGGLFLRAGLSHLGVGTGEDNYGYPAPRLSSTTVFLAAGWQFGLPALPAAGAGGTPAGPPREPEPTGDR